jgi:kinesin family protein 5
MSGQSFAFGGGSRIAKPLRGGGGGGEQLPVAGVPTISSLKDMDSNGSAGKRGSWFSNIRV